MRLSYLAAASAAALLFALPAQAAMLLVTITGDASLSFEMDSQPTLSSGDPALFYGDEYGEMFIDVPLSYAGGGGGGSLGDVVFYSDLGGGGISVLPYTFGDPLILTTGPQIFSVVDTTYDMPIFAPGVFLVTDDIYNLSYTVTITSLAGAVPEPASWALMIAGLALVGSAMRRRPALAFRAA